MNEDVIFRYKNGRIIPIKVNKDKTTNEYMNDKIRTSAKKITKKDIVDGEMYQGADGYWNYDLKEGILSDFGLPYIWNKTKTGANYELKLIIQRENILQERKRNRE